MAMGVGFTVTTPKAAELEQTGVPVVLTTTLYVPATVVLKVATLPGGVTPVGTVQAYEYVPTGAGIAVSVAVAPEQMVGLLTVAVGSGFTTTCNVVVFAHRPAAGVKV